MDGFISMVNAQMILLLYLAVGMYCRMKNIIDDHAKGKLTDLVLKITLPCMIFASFNRPLTPDVLQKTALVLLVALCIALLSFIGGKFLYYRYPHERKCILQYCTLVNNSGFLGMPMVSSVYGAEGLLYASFFIIPNRIMMWSAGLSLFTQSDFKSKCKNILLNPGIIACFLGLARQLLLIPLPGFLDSAIGNIGSTTSPFHDDHRHHAGRCLLEIFAGTKHFLSGRCPPHCPSADCLSNHETPRLRTYADGSILDSHRNARRKHQRFISL